MTHQSESQDTRPTGDWVPWRMGDKEEQDMKGKEKWWGQGQRRFVPDEI